MSYDAVSYEEAKKGVFEAGYMDEIPMADAPAGDIFMNVLDLAKWAGVIMKEGELEGKQFMNNESVQETLKSHNYAHLPQCRRDFAPTLGYGFGWLLDTYKGHTCMQHGNESEYLASYVNFVRANVSTFFFVYLSFTIVVACSTNINITDLPFKLSFDIDYGILGFHKTHDWINVTVLKRSQEMYGMMAKLEDGNIPECVKNKPYTHDLGDYVGDFTHPVYGKIVVTLEKDGEKALHMKLRTSESRLDRHHFEAFKGRVHDFSTKGNVFLIFVASANGNVEAAVVIFPRKLDTLTFMKAEVSRTGNSATPKEE